MDASIPKDGPIAFTDWHPKRPLCGVPHASQTAEPPPA